MASRSENLFICTDTVVSRLDVRQEGGAHYVSGVFMQVATKNHVKNQQEYYVSANSEVIMCLGAIVTPQILMLRYVLSPCPTSGSIYGFVQWDWTSRTP